MSTKIPDPKAAGGIERLAILSFGLAALAASQRRKQNSRFYQTSVPRPIDLEGYRKGEIVSKGEDKRTQALEPQIFHRETWNNDGNEVEPYVFSIVNAIALAVQRRR